MSKLHETLVWFRWWCYYIYSFLVLPGFLDVHHLYRVVRDSLTCISYCFMAKLYFLANVLSPTKIALSSSKAIQSMFQSSSSKYRSCWHPYCIGTRTFCVSQKFFKNCDLLSWGHSVFLLGNYFYLGRFWVLFPVNFTWHVKLLLVVLGFVGFTKFFQGTFWRDLVYWIVFFFFFNSMMAMIKFLELD